MGDDETLARVECELGRIVLNRPQVLNALSPAQFRGLDRTLADWAADAAVAVVVIEGAGERAFCVGGDLGAIWEMRGRGDLAGCRALFRNQYRLDRRVHHYAKPIVALLDGMVMGGGAGLSVNGRFRVASERTLFAMPETAIGFFPDVGATHFLSRCPGRIGLYLGLTGARLGPADCLWAGLATHYVPLAARDALLAGLAGAAGSADPAAAVADTLASLHRDPGPAALAERAEGLDRCFGRETLREVISALIAEGADWAWDAVEPIGDNSPTALAVTFRQLAEGGGLGFDDALRREYRIATRMLAESDFFEGIRAAVVDKDRRPQWRPATLADVGADAVARYFAPAADGELDLDAATALD